TFHIGGAAARGKIEQSSLETKTEGIVRLNNTNLAKREDGSVVVMNRHGELVIMDDTGREREHHRLLDGAPPPPTQGTREASGPVGAEWDPFAMPFLTEVGGVVAYNDLVEGVSVVEKVDEVTGLSRKIVIESRAAELRPRITIIDPATGEPKKLGNTDLDAR